MPDLYQLYVMHPFWAWIALAGALLALEVATGSGWLLWPAASAAIVALLAINAGLDIHKQTGDAARIRQVRIVSPVMKYIDRPQPATGLDGKFSLQYTAAAAMLDGKVGIDTFTDERRFRPDMVGMLAKITLTQDASIIGDFHHMHVAIEADLADGGRVSAICRGPKGSWGVPLAPSDHRDKLNDCFHRALPAVPVGPTSCILHTRSSTPFTFAAGRGGSAF